MIKLGFKVNRLYKLCKFAGVIDNLAKRILHSLVPMILNEKDPDTLKAKFEQAMPYVIPGAEEMIELGGKLIQDEYVHGCTSKDAREKVKGLIGQELFDFAKNDFTKSHFEELFGGYGWSKFSEQLSILNIAVKDYKSTKNIESARKIIIALNVIDALSHNTGSFLHKMTRFQTENDPYEKQTEKEHKLLRLMDIKNLKNPTDTYYEVDHYTKDMQRGLYLHEDNPGFSKKPRSSSEELSDEIEKIRIKKQRETTIQQDIKPIVRKIKDTEGDLSLLQNGLLLSILKVNQLFKKDLNNIYNKFGISKFPSVINDDTNFAALFKKSSLSYLAHDIASKTTFENTLNVVIYLSISEKKIFSFEKKYGYIKALYNEINRKPEKTVTIKADDYLNHNTLSKDKLLAFAQEIENALLE